MHRTIIYTASDARKNFYQVVQQAAQGLYTPTIHLRNVDPVVMISLEDYEGMLETLEIMNDPELVADLKEAAQESVADGTTLEELITELGLEDEVDYPAKGKKATKKTA